MSDMTQNDVLDIASGTLGAGLGHEADHQQTRTLLNHLSEAMARFAQNGLTTMPAAVQAAFARQATRFADDQRLHRTAAPGGSGLDTLAPKTLIQPRAGLSPRKFRR